MRCESYGIETYSPYLDRDLTDINVFDGGDLELCFGDTQKVLLAIQEFTKGILDDNKLPLMIGGEHLVTLGAVRAVLKKYPDLHIIHFDAHADLRQDYLGNPLSHATVMRRCYDLVGEGKIFQFGIRSGDREEFEFAKKHTYLNKFNLDTLPDVVKKLKDKPVYFTIDLDVLDSSVFPGTGTPEAGGIGFIELIEGIWEVCKLRVVGCDMNELSPIYDQSGASTATACKLLRELLLSLNR
jgi:agmatinase